MEDLLINAVGYITDMLNIQTQNALSFEKMIEKISSLRDANAFLTFCENEHLDEKYTYLSGYQKFLALKRDYEIIENEAYKKALFANEIKAMSDRAKEFIALLKSEKHNIITANIKNTPYDESKFEKFQDINPFLHLKDACTDFFYVYEKIMENHKKEIDKKFNSAQPKKELQFNFQKETLELTRSAYKVLT